MSFLAWNCRGSNGSLMSHRPTMLHLSRLAYSTNAQAKLEAFGCYGREIIQIMNNMRSDASPGPDGLNAAFYKASWSWIADDVINLIQISTLRVIFLKATQQEAVTINEVLQNFCALSGRTPKWNKSAILFSKKVKCLVDASIPPEGQQ
ncbi:hypothetical protein U9M48_019773 [Paspalum notatum var. saurae]|uniref:Reverse transcriptase n=1 Tax=Paspalum notatum var. saurae TaxID=547442 RepID=A0AAQ3TG59_PASNO